VGIYKGDGKFVHASSSRTGKVLVSDMSKHYWARRFNGARRILQ
jgi:cell wall-associated NlpC family hydrolase